VVLALEAGAWVAAAVVLGQLVVMSGVVAQHLVVAVVVLTLLGVVVKEAHQLTLEVVVVVEVVAVQLAQAVRLLF
jgi:UDP-N-acetylglucosamine enolpyruvyl transferase